MPGNTPPNPNQGAIVDGSTGEFWKETNDGGLPFLGLQAASENGLIAVEFLKEPVKVTKDFGRGEQTAYQVEVKTLEGIQLLTLSSSRLRAAIRQAFPDGKLVGRKAEIQWAGKNQQRKYAVVPSRL